METVIAAKNFEIARLSDRVQYYEAANREMSQETKKLLVSTFVTAISMFIVMIITVQKLTT